MKAFAMVQAHEGAILAQIPTPTLEQLRTERIRDLNDTFRWAPHGAKGNIVLTRGITALGSEAVNVIFQKVRRFTAFTPDNDPHGEHDFGALDHDGHKVFWTIDYYDASREHGSDDPADAEKTWRVLTVMLADEY